MFIHYEKPRLNSSKMSYINLFLKTELTCVPKLLKNYLGNYYNNALCNGATWVFALWCVLHIIFDKVVDAFLRKVRYKEYVRLRLRSSLWYLGFYGTALIYSGAALAQNEVELFNFKRMHVPSGSDLPMQVMLGYTLISTFYLHSALWEGLTKESFVAMFHYLFLFTFLVSSYILRVVEISFTLTALIGLAQVAVEFTRSCYMSSNQDNLLPKLAVGSLYILSFAVYVATYIVVIPLTFIAPLGIKIMSDYPNILLLFLFFNLVFWLITELYQSVLSKSVNHWLYHDRDPESENFRQCTNSLLECSLFKPRDDVSYNLQILRREIKARETKMMSLRKPKNKGVLIQTLKCMVAIKRKLNEKRLSESSDSDSEKSEDGDLKTRESTEEETAKKQSDGDEESDDEESESQDSVIETMDINKNNAEECVQKDAAGLTEQKNLCPENATGDINQNVDEKPKIVDDLIDLETQPSENKEDINKNTDKDYEVEKSAEKRTDKASVQSDSCDDNFGAMLKGETNVEGAFPLNAALGEKPATATEEVTAVTSVQGKLCISLKENTEIK